MGVLAAHSAKAAIEIDLTSTTGGNTAAGVGYMTAPSGSYFDGSHFDLTFLGNMLNAYTTTDATGVADTTTTTTSDGGNVVYHVYTPGLGSLPGPAEDITMYSGNNGTTEQIYIPSGTRYLAAQWDDGHAGTAVYDVAAFVGTTITLENDVPTQQTAGLSDYWLATTPVPEPTTIISGLLLLLPFGACALRILRRRKAR